MSPTRAFLDGVLKYKATYSEKGDPKNHFIYDFQKAYRDFAHDRASEPQNNESASIGLLVWNAKSWTGRTIRLIA